MKKLFFILITLLSLNLYSQTDYYYNGVGAFTTVTSWGINPDGTGANPVDFTGLADIFHIANTTAAALDANWNLGGSAVVEDGVNFTVGGGALVIDPNALGGTLDIGYTTAATGTITITSSVSNAAKLAGILAGGTVIYNTTATITSKGYWDLIAAASTTLAGNITVHNLTINTGVTLGMSLRRITVSGDINCIGLINGNASANLILNGTSSSSLKFGATQVLRSLTIVPSGAASTFTLGTTLTCSNSATSLFSINNATLDISGQSLTINSNTITLGASGYLKSSSTSSIAVGGGTAAVAPTGSLKFDQTSAATRSLYDLTLNRAGQTLTIGNALEIINSVTPTLGTIASGGFINLIANATRSGRIGIVGGAITGNITVQTYAASSGVTGWTNLASSGITGLTVANWDGQFPITCNGCTTSTTSAGGAFASMQGGYEPGTGGTEYTTVSNTTAIDPGTGFWVYLGTGLTTTTPILITETGLAAQGDVALALTKTAAGQNGYNLIANPYASPIHWPTAATTNSNIIDGSCYVYSPVGGQITTTGAGVSTPSGYIVAGVIPMGQGLYVFANPAAGTFTFTESHKSAANTNANPLLKSNATNSVAEFRLGITDPYGSYDETVIIADNNATPNFDNMLDAYKVFQTPGYSGTGPVYSQYTTINSLSSNKDYAINSLPLSNTQNLVIPIRAKAMVSGTYTINPLQIQNLPSTSCVTLKDNLLNINHDLRSGSYVCTIADTTSAPRFELTICAGSIATSINQVNNTNNNVIIGQDGTSGVFVKTSFDKNTKSVISGYNLMGQKIMADKEIQGSENLIHLDFNETRNQIIIIKVCNDKGQTTKKVFVN